MYTTVLEEANGAAEPEEPKKEAKEAEAEEEKTDSEEDEVNLRQYHPAGGPIVLTLLELPPPPKTAGQWTIRRGLFTVVWISIQHTSVARLLDGVADFVGHCESCEPLHTHNMLGKSSRFSIVFQLLLMVLRCSSTLKSYPEKRSR